MCVLITVHLHRILLATENFPLINWQRIKPMLYTEDHFYLFMPTWKIMAECASNLFFFLPHINRQSV